MLRVAGHSHHFRFGDAERERVRDEGVAATMYRSGSDASRLPVLSEPSRKPVSLHEFATDVGPRREQDRLGRILGNSLDHSPPNDLGGSRKERNASIRIFVLRCESCFRHVVDAEHIAFKVHVAPAARYELTHATVSFQATRAALSDPVRSLQGE